MLGWLRSLDKTHETDVQAFHAGSLISVAVVGLVMVLSIAALPMVVARVTDAGPAIQWPLIPAGFLVWSIILARTPRGRGALWTFGGKRSWSPKQSIIGGLVMTVLLAVAGACFQFIPR